MEVHLSEERLEDLGVEVIEIHGQIFRGICRQGFAGTGQSRIDRLGSIARRDEMCAARDKDIHSRLVPRQGSNTSLLTQHV